MALIAATNKNTLSGAAVTKATLTASDTLVYNKGTGQILELVNTTGSAVALVIKGTGATTYALTGYGALDISAGKTINVAANATVAITLDNFKVYFPSTGVTLTNGTGLTAILYA